MRLEKTYSPVLDCAVWRVRQFACDRNWVSTPITVYGGVQYALRGEYVRNFTAMRVRTHRAAVRQAIAEYQKEQSNVSSSQEG